MVEFPAEDPALQDLHTGLDAGLPILAQAQVDHHDPHEAFPVRPQASAPNLEIWVPEMP